MIPISIVIITKNEAEIIASCIEAVQLIADDIIIVDSSSTDETLSIALEYNCNIHQKNWDGYGTNKNAGVRLAKNDWILSIDADEIPDIELINSINNLDLDDDGKVYDIKFKSYFGNKRVRFGDWGRDHHIRLFNRRLVKWSEPTVHETLLLPEKVKIDKLNGFINHYSVKDAKECKSKAIHYAWLSAHKYFKAGKKSSAVNLYLSPIFGFIKNYILLLGFLDGKEGWHVSYTIFKNKWLKYHYLKQLEINSQKKPTIKNNLAVDY